MFSRRFYQENKSVSSIYVFYVKYYVIIIVFKFVANLHKNFRFIHRRIKIIGNAVKVRQKKAACLAFYMQNELSPKDTSQ